MVSVRRVAPVLLLIAAVPLFGAAKASKKSSHPPREIHRVGDHYTAYFPPDPATYPAGAKTVTIKQGDTLWALANQLFGNAYLWPQLWESNTWITDAHWIYPGDVLLVQGEVAQQAATGATGSSNRMSGGPTTGTGTSGTGTSPTTAATSAAPVPLASEADVYCFGYLGEPNENMPNFVDSFEDAETRYQPGAAIQSMGGAVGDLVFINGGTATGITAGETYLVVEPEELVLHPVTQQVVGRHYDYRGQIRIIRADEHRSAGVIAYSCETIHAGDKLKPLPQIPIPLAHVPEMPTFGDPLVRKSSGFIVRAQGGWHDALGSGLLVEVNVGKDENLNPGDFLMVWRPSSQPGQPPQILGEIGVLTTEAHTATGIIMDMRYSMEIGDHVELR